MADDHIYNGIFAVVSELWILTVPPILVKIFHRFLRIAVFKKAAQCCHVMTHIVTLTAHSLNICTDTAVLLVADIHLILTLHQLFAHRLPVADKAAHSENNGI